MAKLKSNWYASWFDTPYYHKLYQDRDAAEAQIFSKNLVSYLNLPKQSNILDLACGKGRHSRYLNTLGYTVTGIDLSINSIAYAKQYENDTLCFEVHDMRHPYPDQFDAVFNLFTSFGYFEKSEDNLNTIKTIKLSLNSTGYGVIDFMNVNHVINNLVGKNSKTIDGITYNLSRRIHNGILVKDIKFTDKGVSYNFQERVTALTLTDFEAMFKEADLNLVTLFGTYNLEEFNANTSERLIMIFE